MSSGAASLLLLVATSRRVGESRSRLTKIAALARYLVALPLDAVEVAVHYLSGALPQGHIGIGWRALQAAAAQSAAAAPSLQLRDVDATLQPVMASTGSGSAAKRAALLAELFGVATADEQDFLLRLLAGELRQGALDGIMIDAIASAARLPTPDVQRAANKRAVEADTMDSVRRIHAAQG